MPRGDRPKNDGKPPVQLDLRDFAASKPNKRELDQSIEAELAAAMSGMDVSGMLANPETQDRPVAAAKAVALPGGRKKGRVVAIHGKDVFIDVPGGRSQGVMQILQFEGQPPAVGDEIEFAIERYDAANGLLVLTREGAAQSVSDWSSLSLHMIVEARVTGVNKNRTGLMVEVNGIKGFMPISQIDLYRVEQPEQFIDQRMKCEVVELDRHERNLILSRRSLLERERAQLAEQFWATVDIGQTKTGTVSSIQKFGVFVNLGACDGLIPMSELSWSRVNDPSEIVKVGQKVDVVIHRLDRDTRKIALSLKQLHGNPWDDFAKSHKPGARATGTVTRTTEFGAFVELAPGIEGLIHISEISTQRVRRVTEVVKAGQTVDVQILTLDPQQRRIGLSLKTIMAGEEAVAAAATAAEEQANREAAQERLASRPINPNLRGGIGSSKLIPDTDPAS
jgi:small subunit ribosomal protein S1